MTSAIDSINWNSLGVFNDTCSFNELMTVFVVSTVGFATFYYLNKLYFDDIIAGFIGKESPYH